MYMWSIGYELTYSLFITTSHHKSYWQKLNSDGKHLLTMANVYWQKLNSDGKRGNIQS